MKWTAETVEGLAPDAASVAAARKLARPAPWSDAGHDERAVWGLCKGSGSRPYQVQFDLEGPAYNCSCPSRKLPCKHALALMLRLAEGAVPAGERPAWVGEWLEARDARAERAAARPAPGEPPRDPEAAARRAAEREARVAAGVEDLRLWLRDAVRGGLGAPRLRGWDEWDGFAARLVDAQAPGAASRLRSLGSVAAGRPDGWPERLLSGLGLLHLLCEAHERADGPLRDDVRILLGWNVAREDVLAGEHVRDRWAVLARTILEQERLRVQRTWLWGLEHGRPALLLDFAPPGGTLEPRPPAGTAIDADLAFYPGATPLRALIAGGRATVGGGADAPDGSDAVEGGAGEPGRSDAVEGGAGVPGGSDAVRDGAAAPGRFGSGGAEAALAAAAAALAANPWLDEWPVAIAAAVPDGRAGGPWTLAAIDGALPLAGPERARWRLLALAAGRPVSVFGLWNGETLAPLAAADGHRTVPL
jgi:hypothetical protein